MLQVFAAIYKQRHRRLFYTILTCLSRHTPTMPLSQHRAAYLLLTGNIERNKHALREQAKRLFLQTSHASALPLKMINQVNVSIFQR